MTISEPWERNTLMSSEGGAAEDTRRRAGGYSGGGRSSESKEGEAARVGCADRNWVTMECIWVASSLGYGTTYVRSVFFTRVTGANLVGLIISAPIWFGPNLPLLRISFSRTGTTKASVFPEPVTASTTTSLCCMNNGIVAAWTGVICVWPIAPITSRLSRRFEMSSGWSRPKRTHIHGVRGMGREGQVPARAAAAIKEERTQLGPRRHLPFAVGCCHDCSSAFEKQFDCLSEEGEAVIG